MHAPWLIPCRANIFTSYKKQLSRKSCASLVPLGMKWACSCAGDGECACKEMFCVMCLCLCVLVCIDCVMQCVVIVVVVVLLVASVLASMRWLLRGEKMRVQKKTSVIVHKLPRSGFISIMGLINSKKKALGPQKKGYSSN